MNTTERAKQIAEQNGRPWNEMGAYEREEYMDAAREVVANVLA